MKIKKLKVKTTAGNKTGHAKQNTVMNAWLKSRELRNKLLQK
jgi:hypothetical protein